jgi:hypothetical protein
MLNFKKGDVIKSQRDYEIFGVIAEVTEDAVMVKNPDGQLKYIPIGSFEEYIKCQKTDLS